jgi:hypothetical protein
MRNDGGKIEGREERGESRKAGNQESGNQVIRKRGKKAFNGRFWAFLGA